MNASKNQPRCGRPNPRVAFSGRRCAEGSQFINQDFFAQGTNCYQYYALHYTHILCLLPFPPRSLWLCEILFFLSRRRKDSKNSSNGRYGNYGRYETNRAFTREVIAKTSLGPPYVHFWRHGTSCILGCGLYIMIGCGVLWPSWPVN